MSHTEDPLWIRTALKLKKSGVSWKNIANEVYEAIGEEHHPDKIRGALRRRIVEKEDSLSDLHIGILALLQKGPQKLNVMSDRFDRGVSVIAKAVEDLKNLYDIDDCGDEYTLSKVSVAEDKTHKLDVTDNRFKFALVSDTHLSSKCQQLSYLNDFYDRVVDYGAKIVFHSGDISDGEDVYKGHRYEVFCLGADAQVDYAIENYPQREGVETHFITGNHDLCYYKRQGQDIGKYIAAGRSDLVYLGQIGTYIEIVKDVNLYLLHPDGGGAYAVSYKPQKIAAGFAGGEKPRIMSLGHWHQGMTMIERNIHIILPMSFQSQTQYLKRKGLMPKIGGYLCEAFMEDGGVRELTTTAVNYYRPVKDDY